MTATASTTVSGQQTVDLAVGGTATNGTDYFVGSNGNTTITILSGQTSGSTSFNVNNDDAVEGSETAVLSLTNLSSGLALGSPASQTITIIDDDAPPVPTVSIAATDATGGEAGSDPITFTISRTGATTDPLTVTYTVGGTATNGTDYTPALTGTVTIPASQSSVVITLTPTDDAVFDPNETVVLTVTDGVAYDLGTASADATITDNEVAPATRIRDIQGVAHRSPLVGQAVTSVAGIVTARASNGFYMQDPNPDADERTSEGIFVFTGSGTAPAASILVGDGVQVSGTVAEFGTGTNLTVTQIGSPTITELSDGQTLPAAVILGTGGRAIPTSVIEDDNFTSFDPATDGVDFYESVEGMRVQINNPVAVSPTITSGGSRGEVWVLADNGVNATATGRTARGGIVVSVGDFNPERIQIDDNLLNPPTDGFVTPTVNVGAQFNTITGIINYAAGNYELLATSLPIVATASPLTKEITNLTGTANQLTVATFNVENLDPGDATFGAIAGRIVNNLRSPDILLLEEIQDNNGATNDGTVDASTTFNQLISAITTAGGPTYQFRQINPLNNQDGGEPGGNIRVGFLFNPGRVAFVDRAGGTATSPTTVNNVNGQPQLSLNPGRVDPTNPAFDGAGANSPSRKPLAGEFVFNGQTVFVIGNHFNSKGGDTPLFGNAQPPALSSETQRNQQATVVRDFVRSILSVNASANVIVAGDLNDFEFSNPLNTLKGTPLTALIETLPGNERYTYNFEGNAQTLDHILISNSLTGNRLDGYDVVHFNSEFSDQDSDHDPSVARFNLTAPTTPLALSFTASPTQILTTGTTTLSATVSGGTGPYTYTFSGPGTITQIPTSNTASVSGLSAGVRTFTVTVTDGTSPTSQTITGMVSVTVSEPAAQVPTVGVEVVANAEEDQLSRNRIGNLRFTRSTSVGEQIVNYSIGGSATNGVDYVSLPGSVTFTEGSSIMMVVVDPIDDFSVEGTETVLITLLDGAAYDVDPLNPSATLSITENDGTNQAPVVNNPIPSQTATVGQPFGYVIPANTFSDPNGDALTLTVDDLPAGLSFNASTSAITGTPTSATTTLVTVGATDPGGLSANTRFEFRVNPSTGTTAPFAITGVTTIDCTPVANRINVNFNPRYAGLSGQPVSFSVVNELSSTTAPGPYTLQLYADNPTITLKATQSGTVGEASFSYNWLAACNSLSMVTPNNTAPTVANAIPPQSATAGQAFSYVIPANTFTDAETPNQLTLSANGLPPGLSLSGTTISGTPSTTVGSPYSVTVTATDPGSLSVATSFTITVSPAASMTSSPFSITSVTTIDCTPVANRIAINFNPQYAGATGQPISFSVVNELSPTTAPGPYSLTLYPDNPVITLKATQSGTAGEASFNYNWLAACNSLSMVSPNNTAPTTTGIANQSGTVNQGFSLNVASSFSDAETPNQLSYSATGLPVGLSLSGSTISGTPSMSGVSNVTVTATDPGSLSVSTSFSLTVSPAASMTSTAPFAITGVTTVSCQPVGNQINLTFNPQYAGTNDQPISFSVVNELSSTTAPGPYTLQLYPDNPTISLKATQTGTTGEVSFAYNWLAACTSSSGARIGAEPVAELELRVLGNPVENGQVRVEVRGAAGQPLGLTLLDLRGQPIGSHQVRQAGSVERHTFQIDRQSAGVLLLRATTSGQILTVKVLRVD